MITNVKSKNSIKISIDTDVDYSFTSCFFRSIQGLKNQCNSYLMATSLSQESIVPFDAGLLWRQKFSQLFSSCLVTRFKNFHSLIRVFFSGPIFSAITVVLRKEFFKKISRLLLCLFLSGNFGNASENKTKEEDNFTSLSTHLKKSDIEKYTSKVEDFNRQQEFMDKLKLILPNDEPLFNSVFNKKNEALLGPLVALVLGSLAIFDDKRISSPQFSRLNHHTLENRYSMGDDKDFLGSSGLIHNRFEGSILNGKNGYYYFAFITTNDKGGHPSLLEKIGKIPYSDSELISTSTELFNVIKGCKIAKNSKYLEKTYNYKSLISEIIVKTEIESFPSLFWGVLHIGYEHYFKISGDPIADGHLKTLKREMFHNLTHSKGEGDKFVTSFSEMKGVESITVLHGPAEFLEIQEPSQARSVDKKPVPIILTSLTKTLPINIDNSPKRPRSMSKEMVFHLTNSSDSFSLSISPRTEVAYNIHNIFNSIPMDLQVMFNKDLTFKMDEVTKREEKHRKKGLANDVSQQIFLLQANTGQLQKNQDLLRNLNRVIGVVPLKVQKFNEEYKNSELIPTIESLETVKGVVLDNISKTTNIPLKLLRQIALPEYYHVLSLWFEEFNEDQFWITSNKKDIAIINSLQIRNLYEKATKLELDHWRITPEGTLAEILLLDQFSFMIYRGKSEAYYHAKSALPVAQAAVEKGFCKTLDDNRILFLLLPIIHSESLKNHLSIKSYIRNSFSDYFRKHHDLLKEFERFPQLNADYAFNRESTSSEKKFLKKNKNYFG